MCTPEPTAKQATPKSTPHNDLRVIEAKLREYRSFIPSDAKVWGALDRLWDFVVLGDREAQAHAGVAARSRP